MHENKSTNQDFAAVKDSCACIKTLINNFNAPLDILSPEALEHIRDFLYVHSSEILIKDAVRSKAKELDMHTPLHETGTNICVHYLLLTKAMSSELLSEDALTIRKDTGAYPKHYKSKHSQKMSRHSAQLVSDDTSCSSPATNFVAVP